MTTAAMLLLWSSAAQARTIYVPGQDGDNLEDALRAAVDGDVIEITQSSSYSVTTDWVATNQSVTIQSASAAQVEIPAVKVYGGAEVTLDRVRVIGSYPASVEMAQVTVERQARVFVDGAWLTVFDSDLSYDANQPADIGLLAVDSDVDLSGVVANDYPDHRGAYVASDSTPISVYIEDSEFSGNGDGGLYLHGTYPDLRATSSVEIVSTVFSANSTDGNGGGLYLEHFELVTLSGCDFEANQADGAGGGLYVAETQDVQGSDLGFYGLDGDGNPTGAGRGGGIAIENTESFGTLTLSEAHFESLRATASLGLGGAILASGTDLVLLDVVAEDLEATGGAFLALQGAALSLHGLELRGYTVGRLGGALLLDGVYGFDEAWGFAEVYDALLCDGSADSSAANAVVLVAQDSLIEVRNAVVMQNQGEGLPAMEFIYADAIVGQSTFVGNRVATLVTGSEEADVYVYGDIFAGAGDSPVGARSVGANTIVYGEYNLWWELYGGEFTGTGDLDFNTTVEIIGQDPEFLFPETFVDCPRDAYVRHGSPAVDGVEDGNYLPETGLEDDDTRPDIGAAGGVYYPFIDTDQDGTQDRYDCDPTNAYYSLDAREVWYDGVDQDCDGNDDDRDTDGWPVELDCDDGDSAIHPEQDEVWYDGVDANCDGQNDNDADGDGYESEEHGGEDCDDHDASVSPSAVEVWYDGVDVNCDGNDFDADGDGHKSLAAHAGDDCNDSDPNIHPTAVEVPDDGVDQDCNGQDLVTPTGSPTATRALSGGCASVGGGGGLGLALLGLLLLTRRRL